MLFGMNSGVNSFFTFSPQCSVDKSSPSEKPRAHGEGEMTEQDIHRKPAQLAAGNPKQMRALGDIRDKEWRCLEEARARGVIMGYTKL